MIAWLIACAFFLLVAVFFDVPPKSRVARDPKPASDARAKPTPVRSTEDKQYRASGAVSEPSKQKPAGKRAFTHRGNFHNKYSTTGWNNQLTPWVNSAVANEPRGRVSERRQKGK